MLQVNIHEAKTNLSSLIANAMKGESFIIAKSGKPLVKVSALTEADTPKRKIGFLKGIYNVPDDFDELGTREIINLFGVDR